MYVNVVYLKLQTPKSSKSCCPLSEVAECRGAAAVIFRHLPRRAEKVRRDDEGRGWLVERYLREMHRERTSSLSLRHVFEEVCASVHR